MKATDKNNNKAEERLQTDLHLDQNGNPPDYLLQAKKEGSQELVDKYNINDQAHEMSSSDDFVKTTSNFNHAKKDKNPKK